MGREFHREDELPDNNQVVILSHGLWQRSFNAIRTLSVNR